MWSSVSHLCCDHLLFQPNNFCKCKLRSIKFDWKCIQVDLISYHFDLVEKMRMRFLNLIFGFLNFSACNHIPSPIEVVNQVLSHRCISVQSWVHILFDSNSYSSELYLRWKIISDCTRTKEGLIRIKIQSDTRDMRILKWSTSNTTLEPEKVETLSSGMVFRIELLEWLFLWWLFLSRKNKKLAWQQWWYWSRDGNTVSD